MSATYLLKDDDLSVCAKHSFGFDLVTYESMHVYTYVK